VAPGARVQPNRWPAGVDVGDMPSAIADNFSSMFSSVSKVAMLNTIWA
jgi:hypothetical protein